MVRLVGPAWSETAWIQTSVLTTSHSFNGTSTDFPRVSYDKTTALVESAIDARTRFTNTSFFPQEQKTSEQTKKIQARKVPTPSSKMESEVNIHCTPTRNLMEITPSKKKKKN